MVHMILLYPLSISRWAICLPIFYCNNNLMPIEMVYAVSVKLLTFMPRYKMTGINPSKLSKPYSNRLLRIRTPHKGRKIHIKAYLVKHVHAF